MSVDEAIARLDAIAALRAQRDEARELLLEAADYVREIRDEGIAMPARLVNWLAAVDAALEDAR